MLERIRAALLTYSEKTAFRVLGLVVIAVSLLETLLFRMDSISIISYSSFAIPLVVTYSALVANQLSRQFAPGRKQLMPGFASAHFGAAIAATLLLVIMLALPVVLSARPGFQRFPDWKDVSFDAVLAALWFSGLVAASAVYFGGPTATFAVFLPAIFLGSTQVRHFVFMILADRHRGIPALLLIDLVATTVLVWRIAYVDEEAKEYRRQLEQNSRDSERRWWRGSSGTKRLDHIVRPLKRNLWSQLRHFQLSFPIPAGVLRSELMFVATLWAINAGLGIGRPSQWLIFFSMMPIMTIVSVIKERRNGLQVEFMLPFKRNEIIVRLGGALFLSVFRSWLGYAAATYFVAWMPLPGVIQGIPSAVPLLVSLAAQFPLFGIAMIALMLGQVKLIYLGVGILLAVAAFYTAVASNTQAAIVITVLVALGGLSIWYSYRRWCWADI